MGLTALDIVVMLFVGGGLVLGYVRGFVVEVMSLLAWVAAIAALKLLHAPLSDLLAGMVGTYGGAAVLAFAILFLIPFAGVKLLANHLSKAAKASFVGTFDHILGGGFGALKGLIGATILYLLASLVYDVGYGRTAERPDWMIESRSYPLLNASGRAIVDFVEARQKVGEEANSQDVADERRRPEAKR
jgi:membrane protein required for colicin V production